MYLFKASTRSVLFCVLHCHRSLLVVFLFFPTTECVLIWSVTCVYFVNQLYILYHILIINFRLWYEGTPKYLGESVTGLELEIWK